MSAEILWVTFATVGNVLSSGKPIRPERGRELSDYSIAEKYILSLQNVDFQSRLSKVLSVKSSGHEAKLER
jgi:hypothetical protein